MESMNIEYKNGNWTFAGDQRAQIDALLRRVGASGDVEQHKMLAQTIIPPIRQVAAYEEWSQWLFQPSRNFGATEKVYFALDDPSMVALYTSPSGEVAFTRPGRTTYVEPSVTMVDCGLELGWDDLEASGWDKTAAKVQEAGEEMARKRDAIREAVLEAAVLIGTDHVQTVATTMTKAAVDLIFKAAATAQWKITRVAINPATIMDTTGWTWSSATHLWENITKDAELFNGLAVFNYGGATWRTFSAVSSTEIWFSAEPTVTGAFDFSRGGMRSASDVDIRKRVDIMTWDEKKGAYLGNPYAIWKLEIT